MKNNSKNLRRETGKEGPSATDIVDQNSGLVELAPSTIDSRTSIDRVTRPRRIEFRLSLIVYAIWLAFLVFVACQASVE